LPGKERHDVNDAPPEGVIVDLKQFENNNELM